MEDSALHPAQALVPQPWKGRGTAANVDHRFTTASRNAEDDGWWREPAAAPRTELLIDRAKTVITRNHSPDLAFEQSVNPYRGCEHGCVYCYARPMHAWIGLSPGLDFETKILHKPDAAQLLKAELAQPGYRCTPIALGTATDAYQPVERKLGLTRAVLEILLAARHPVSLVTKSSLVTRDIDLWAELARQRLAQVCISLTSLDSELSRRLEPRACAPKARLEAIGELAAAGVPVSVFVAPLIPALNDHELEKLLAAAREHGATSASYTLLRLPHEVAGLFQDWLDRHAPAKAARIMTILYDLRGGRPNDPNFGSRMTGLGHYATLIRQRFELACRRLDLAREWPEMDCSRFRPPVAAAEQRQMSLF